MNAAVLKLEKALSSGGSVHSTSKNDTNDTMETKRKFAIYFFEQLIALIGTWVQQVVLGWVVHAAPHTLTSISFFSPQVGGTLTLLCSGVTWLLLTVWSFKIRECLRKSMTAINLFGSQITKTEIARCRRLLRQQFQARTTCC